MGRPSFLAFTLSDQRSEFSMMRGSRRDSTSSDGREAKGEACCCIWIVAWRHEAKVGK